MLAAIIRTCSRSRRRSRSPKRRSISASSCSNSSFDDVHRAGRERASLMLTSLVELAERLALRTSPPRAVELLGLIPTPALEAMRRARFTRTLHLAAERSTFYREQFRRRGIDLRRIEHPSQLGDFYTTGEDLRAHGAEAFLTGR